MVSSTIDSNTITQVRISEDLLAIGDGQRRTPAPARRGIEGLQGRDS
jgi:hypothetical protein